MEDSKQLAKSISAVCRAARLEQGWSQEEVSKLLNVSVEFYARLERGSALPSVPTLARLGRVLRVSLDRLVYGAPRGAWPVLPLLR